MLWQHYHDGLGSYTQAALYLKQKAEEATEKATDLKATRPLHPEASGMGSPQKAPTWGSLGCVDGSGQGGSRYVLPRITCLEKATVSARRAAQSAQSGTISSGQPNDLNGDLLLDLERLTALAHLQVKHRTPLLKHHTPVTPPPFL